MHATNKCKRVHDADRQSSSYISVSENNKFVLICHAHFASVGNCASSNQDHN